MPRMSELDSLRLVLGVLVVITVLLIISSTALRTRIELVEKETEGKIDVKSLLEILRRNKQLTLDMCPDSTSDHNEAELAMFAP